MRSERERGQATPEWVALALLLALVVAALAAAGLPVPGADLARSIAARIVCATGMGDECAADRGDLVLAYGAELAAAVTEHAPRLEYEEGMHAVPVDFRSCRDDACAEGAESGPVAASSDGERVTAFVHVVDCRNPGEARREGYDCTGDRAQRIYVQYWLYYPGSATARALIGDAGAHPDDWESFQVRVGPDGTVDARASSHHGYNGDSGDWLSDSGLIDKAGWTDSTGRYFISGGSHAGRIGEDPPARRRLRLPFDGPPRAHRWTERAAIRIIPIEPLESAGERWEFAVAPPWAKRVYRDPEYRGTD